MSTYRTSIIIGAIVLLAIIGMFIMRALPTKTAAAATQPIQVRWLQSHQPTDVFARATQVFADTLARESDGAMTLQVVTPQQAGVAVGDVPSDTVFKMLNSGDVQLATDYTVALGDQDNDLWALNLPFSFASYDQLPAVLDGAVGQQLLAGIDAKTSAHGLAFTMSGGFRIIATKDKAISSPADLKGLHIATSGGPVAEATLKALGAIPVPLDLESGNATIDPKTIDGVETTYSRLSQVIGTQNEYTKYINETDHSMFLTTILASNSFYASLSTQNQKALQDAALAAAKVERQDSIALGESTRSQLASEGSVITTLTPAQRDVFKQATQSVYSQFGTMFSGNLLNAFTPAH